MQPELPLFQANEDDPNVRQFISLLRRSEDWLTSAGVLRSLGLPDTESNRRYVRAWAEAAEDEVISGQKGYRHIERCTPEEISHFASWMLSQGKKMIRRAIKTRRHAHALVG